MEITSKHFFFCINKFFCCNIIIIDRLCVRLKYTVDMTPNSCRKCQVNVANRHSWKMMSCFPPFLFFQSVWCVSFCIWCLWIPLKGKSMPCPHPVFNLPPSKFTFHRICILRTFPLSFFFFFISGERTHRPGSHCFSLSSSCTAGGTNTVTEPDQ